MSWNSLCEQYWPTHSDVYAGQNDASLFAAFATAAKQCVSSFDLQNLTNTTWAFATAKQQVASLFAASATVSDQQRGSFSPQDLANTAWAFAIAGHNDPTILTWAMVRDKYTKFELCRS